MNQFEREQRRLKEEQEAQQKKTVEFLTECYNKLIRWQLDNSCVLIPFISGPWMRGQTKMEADITFRPMTEEDKKVFEEQTAKNAGIDLK